MKKLIISFLVFELFLVFTANTSFAREEDNHPRSLAKTMGTPSYTLSNINAVAHWIYSDGLSAHDPYTNGNGVYYPRGTFGAGVIYTDGLVWGGFVKDGQQPELRVGGTTYTTGLIAGAILSPGNAEKPDAADVRIWRIRRDWETADLRQDAAEYFNKSLVDVTDDDVQKLRDQYALDWKEWPWQKGAPFYDVNGNGVLDYGYSEDLNGNGTIDFPGEIEEPGLAGADQVIWFVANDLNEGRTLQLYGSPPIGLEMQTTFWAYNRTDALGKIIFKRYRLIYKGRADTPTTATIDSMFIAQWSDPDLGEYADDFVGCDTTLSLSFVYNSVTTDVKFRAYDLAPPAAGYDFLQGPIIYTGDPNDVAIFDLKKRVGYKNLPMTAFNYFAAGSAISDPDREEYAGTLQWYNLMNGLLPRKGTSFTKNDGVTPTKFTLAGDPVTGEGDLDGVILPAGDRRMQMITGPFQMAYGDTQEVVVALVVGLGADRISSVAVLKFNDISAQNAYDNLFQLPKAPQSPKLSITNLDRKVLLNWGEDPVAIQATEGQDVQGYKFEGYNVYQLPSAQATFKDAIKLATFDLVNEVTTILDPQFDEASGQILLKPVQLGKNTGIQRTLTVTKDAFTGKPLVNGTDYFFAVTAYNYNPSQDVPIHSLESSLIIKRATPQSSKPGVRYQYNEGEKITIEHQGLSDGTVEVVIIDPTKTTGHEYKVQFEEKEEGIVWHLIDVTENDTLLKDVTDQSEEQLNPIIDGFTIKVMGPPPGINPNRIGVAYGEGTETSANYLRGWDFSGTRWISGTDVGGIGLFGGLLNGFEFFGSTVGPADYVDVELRFTDDPDTSNMNEWQNAVVYRRDQKYAFAGVGKVPFQAWDVWNNRQLNVCFVEMDSIKTPSGNPVPANGIWDMAWDGTEFGELGGREYLFIMSSTYVEDPSTIYNDDNWGPASDVLYAIWPSNRGNHPYLEAKFTLSIFASRVNTEADTFSFKTEAPTYTRNVAVADVEKIKVYPNPYYGFNPRELSTQGRFVAFNHLPQKATFRIFDLAGNLIRTLEKDDDSQFFRWDLKNHNELPVASGIYIIHIDMPKLGKTKILKLAVVREEEFIEIY